MTNNQDARPFIDLKKDAEEFRAKFDEDIRECINFLDAKITSLICDPDSLGHEVKNVKQNALTEFSKAKYDIFISVKSLINGKEREWLNYMSEMKKLFIENVEIFLAGTKLEIKLPSSEFQSSLGPRKSPGNRKSNSASVTSSIYPIINFTKSIPVLGSPLQRQKVPSKVSEEICNVGDKVHFNRRGRLSASSVKLANSASANAFYQKESSDSSDSSENEGTTERETFDVEMDVGEATFDLNTSQSGSNSSIKSKNSDLDTSWSGLRRRSSSKKEIDLVISGLPQKDVSVLENSLDANVSESVANSYQLISKVRGRRSKLSVKNSKIEDEFPQKNSPEDNEETTVPDQTIDSFETIPKKFIGRQTSKSKKAAVPQSSSSSSEETEEVKKAETSNNQVPLKGRRGRQAAKNKANNSTVLPPVNQITEDTDAVNGESLEDAMNSNVRRGRSAVSKNTKNISVKNIITGRGRRAAKAMIEEEEETCEPTILYPDKNVITGRGRRVAKPVIEEETFEPGTSKLSKRVAFAADGDISDDLDICTPIARSAKSTVRRKTLLPNLGNVSGADIIPGNPTRSKSKRKTFSGVSELETAAPSKRLKVSSRKNVSSQEEDNVANDNLLESDDNYSEWMALKNVDGKVPTRPAIYEVKVWRAKKPAYIDSCESLRQKLTLYKLRQNSGHKHLDKFVERNYDDIQVRYEIVSSLDDAKAEVKSRIKSFVAQYKTTPAYN